MTSKGFAAAATPNPGLKYYYAAPEAPVVDVEADIIVYGGTSGGVIAAVQAARQGNSTALVVFGRHVGGMTSGGLTSTDGVDASVQGGLTREYFDVTGDTGFAPSAAEAAFEAMISDPVPGADWDAPIPTYYEQRLERVEKVGTQIIALHMENGSVFRGKIFIDCTYEGDLMAMAGVPYTYGREARSQYGEFLAGRRASVALPGVNAYNTPGDPGSGLIYNLLENETEGTVGQADSHVQAYNFRIFTALSNTQPLWKPDGYNADHYKLLYRYHKSGGSTQITVGNDINNHEMFDRGVSTDHIGGNRWPDGNGGYIPWWEADYETRELIFQSHVNWQLGMLWYVKTDPEYAALTTDPSVNASQRSAIQTAINTMNAIGLPQGEYPETNGWPHELYIREARRMVSDYVTTQAHYDRVSPVYDPVGLANYRADAHHSRRFAAADGTVRVEGDTGGNNQTPWPISYQSLVPPAGNTTNLLVPWCISASHVAFCSMRMEPCFMVLSQSASTAAGLAIAGETSVQDVKYSDLKLRLLADGQLLGSIPVLGKEVIVDNVDAAHVTISGNWLTSSSLSGYYGSNYLHDEASGSGKSVRYTPDLPFSEVYDVYLRWTAHENRATNVPVTVTYAGGVANLTLNQQQNGSVWHPIGSWTFEAGTSGNITISDQGANGYVVADAVRLVRKTDEAFTAVGVFTANPYAYESDNRPARIQVIRYSDFYNSPLEVQFSISGTATSGTDYQPLASSVIIPAGQQCADIWIHPISDDISQGSRTVLLTLSPDEDYTIAARASAEVTVLDKPADDWRYRMFSPLGDQKDAFNSPDADPDHDGRNNLLERYFDSDPLNGANELEKEPKIVSEWINGELWMGLEWQRTGDARDMNAGVLFSLNPDLYEWLPLSTPIETLEWIQASGARTFRQKMNTSGMDKVFFRLSVQ